MDKLKDIRLKTNVIRAVEFARAYQIDYEQRSLGSQRFAPRSFLIGLRYFFSSADVNMRSAYLLHYEAPDLSFSGRRSFEILSLNSFPTVT